MCAYCYCGDHAFKWDPPWPKPGKELNPLYPWHPLVPQPVNPQPINPWPLDRLREYEDMLRRIKELEDKLGCPCEPNKADYLDLFRKRIEALERKIGIAHEKI